MTINIPLSTELLMWWIKNAKLELENYTLTAPLPIRLDFAGQSIDLAKAGVKLEYSFGEEAQVSGRVGVSSTNKDAQARMLGLEFLRDHAEFKLTADEQKIISLMCEAADTIACRATNKCLSYDEMFNAENDSKDEDFPSEF